MFELKTNSKPLLLKGASKKSVCTVELTVNSKEENSQDFCPNYVQEFGLPGVKVEIYRGGGEVNR
jgi:hypothetical protein